MTKKQELTLNQYEANAHSTIANSTADHLDRVLTPELVGILTRYVALSRSIDNYKKAAFYGRNVNTFPEVTTPMDRKGVPFELIHSALGIAGEAGEVVELLVKVLEGEITYEEAQEELKGELGDVLWYLTVGAKASADGLEEVAKFNNKKLADRWGDKPEANDFKS